MPETPPRRHPRSMQSNLRSRHVDHRELLTFVTVNSLHRSGSQAEFSSAQKPGLHGSSRRNPRLHLTPALPALNPSIKENTPPIVHRQLKSGLKTLLISKRSFLHLWVLDSPKKNQDQTKSGTSPLIPIRKKAQLHQHSH